MTHMYTWDIQTKLIFLLIVACFPLSISPSPLNPMLLSAFPTVVIGSIKSEMCDSSFTLP